MGLHFGVGEQKVRRRKHVQHLPRPEGDELLVVRRDTGHAGRGVVPPLLTIGAVPVTEVTVPLPVPGMYPNAVVTSLLVNVTAPVRVLKLVTPPADPLLALVNRP